MLKSLLQRWRPAPVSTAADLATFLDHRAALVTQKSVVGYCIVKTHVPLSELVTEKAFADAFERSRWEGYGSVLADLVVVAESYLRPVAADRASALPGRLAALYDGVLRSHPMPAHRPEGWGADVDRLRLRLHAAQAGPPRPVATVAEASAERLYATLPIHERLREPDKPAIVANVKFLMVGLVHEFEKQLDTKALVADLLRGDNTGSGAGVAPES